MSGLFVFSSHLSRSEEGKPGGIYPPSPPGRGVSWSEGGVVPSSAAGLPARSGARGAALPNQGREGNAAARVGEGQRQGPLH
jgi:hypothetical protein